MERAVIIANMEGSSLLSGRHFNFVNTSDDPESFYRSKDLKTITEDVERQLIKRALKDANNDIQTASKFLGIDRATLYRKIKKYGFSAS